MTTIQTIAPEAQNMINRAKKSLFLALARGGGGKELRRCANGLREAKAAGAAPEDLNPMIDPGRITHEEIEIYQAVANAMRDLALADD